MQSLCGVDQGRAVVGPPRRGTHIRKGAVCQVGAAVLLDALHDLVAPVAVDRVLGHLVAQKMDVLETELGITPRLEKSRTSLGMTICEGS